MSDKKRENEQPVEQESRLEDLTVDESKQSQVKGGGGGGETQWPAF